MEALNTARGSVALAPHSRIGNRSLGNLCERIAASFYRRQGFQIVRRQWHFGWAEVDLLVRRYDRERHVRWVLVEVRSYGAHGRRPCQWISGRKKRRLAAVATHLRQRWGVVPLQVELCEVDARFHPSQRWAAWVFPRLFSVRCQRVLL